MVNIKAKNVHLEADIKLDSEITLISGDSGVGKTYLSKFLSNCKAINTLHIEPNDYILNVVVTLNDLRGILLDGKKHIIMIDKIEQWAVEDRNAAENLIISDICNRTEFNYYIIIYRGVLNLISYVSDLYYLQFDKNNVVSLRSAPVV